MEFNERMENWARWTGGMQGERAPQGHCRSIEYRYKNSEEVEGILVRRPEINEADAAKVERAWRGLPPVFKDALRFEWINGYGYMRKNYLMGEGEYLRRMSVSLGVVKAGVFDLIGMAEKAISQALKQGA